MKENYPELFDNFSTADITDAMKYLLNIVGNPKHNNPHNKNDAEQFNPELFKAMYDAAGSCADYIQSFCYYSLLYFPELVEELKLNYGIFNYDIEKIKKVTEKHKKMWDELNNE